MKVYANVTKVNQDVVREEGQYVVRGYADITLEDCCKLTGMRIVEGKEGQLFAAYPQKPIYESGVHKTDKEGHPLYTDIYYAVAKQENGGYAHSRELNDTIKNLVLEAYKSDEGYAYINPQKGEHSVDYIEPVLHKCEHERTKAAGNLLVAGCVEVRDVFVNMYTRTDNQEKFLAVSYPGYMHNGERHDYVEPMEKGKRWDREAKAEVDCNFKVLLEVAMKKKAQEFHPELAEQLKGGLDEVISSAKEEAAKQGAKGQAEKEKEALPM